jgi:hypothetical protein
MIRIPEKEALQKVAHLLEEWLNVSEDEARVSYNLPDKNIDGYISIRNHNFNVEIKSESNSAQVSSAIQALKNFSSIIKGSAIPLVAVPFMGEVGRKLCKEAGISWLDLSGNADISAHNLRLLITGQPNLFKGPGRPANPFASKSSRIARWLLIHSDKAMSQRELALKTDMDEGFTSRIISRLEAEGLVGRKKDGTVQVLDPGLLLDSWQEVNDFNKHQILKGHIAERSSSEVLKKLSNLLVKNEMPYAATGLCAAWLLNEYATFRIVTFYIKSPPSGDLLKELGFREESSGSNVWIVVPNDEGVFHGSNKVEGIRCVHPVQAYLDLFGHPERAKEAAENIRHEILKWNKNG